jgi:CRP/FNR family transcriptional regulator, anaerobic regulatory protein
MPGGSSEGCRDAARDDEPVEAAAPQASPMAEPPLLPVARRREVAPRETLFTAGDPADDVFQVASGVLLSYKLLADGRRQVLDFLHPGDLIGLVPTPHFPYGVDAVTRATLMVFPRAVIEARRKAVPELSSHLLVVAREEVLALQERALCLGRRNALERLGCFLAQQERRTRAHDPHGDAVLVPMTRADIADYLGITHETVSRTLAALVRAGVIAFAGRHRIVIRRPDELCRLAECACDAGRRRA